MNFRSLGNPDFFDGYDSVLQLIMSHPLFVLQLVGSRYVSPDSPMIRINSVFGPSTSLFNRQPLFSLGVAERKCDAESAQ
jgi:hypothetical protein